jgi:pimeloyl-ACP methyl ester carboxylesterase
MDLGFRRDDGVRDRPCRDQRFEDVMPEKIPLLLLPGLLCDAALWQAQVADLADVALPVVADMTRDDSLDGMARRALAAAPQRFALAGLSMGGYAALALMRMAPERVARLALLDTSARPDTPEQTQRRRDLIALAERGRFKGVPARLMPLFVHPDRLGDAALTEAIAAMAARVGKDAFLRQQTAIMARADSRPHLPEIACPTLVLCGREDALTPPAASEEIAALVPGAVLEIVERSGHMTTMERPAEVNAALRRWLVG